MFNLKVNSIPKSAQTPLGPRDAIAAALWLGAFTYEVVADRQKTNWRAEKDKKLHDEEFISRGTSFSFGFWFLDFVEAWCLIWSEESKC